MSVKITWDCDNKEVPFNIYRSSEYMDEFSPPMPIAYNLPNTMEYLDEGVEDEFFYMIGAVLNGKLYLSEQVRAMLVKPGHFVVDVNFKYRIPKVPLNIVMKPQGYKEPEYVIPYLFNMEFTENTATELVSGEILVPTNGASIVQYNDSYALQSNGIGNISKSVELGLNFIMEFTLTFTQLASSGYHSRVLQYGSGFLFLSYGQYFWIRGGQLWTDRNSFRYTLNKDHKIIITVVNGKGKIDIDDGTYTRNIDGTLTATSGLMTLGTAATPDWNGSCNFKISQFSVREIDD